MLTQNGQTFRRWLRLRPAAFGCAGINVNVQPPDAGHVPLVTLLADLGRQVVDVKIEIVQPAPPINPFGQLGRIG